MAQINKQKTDFPLKTGLLDVLIPLFHNKTEHIIKI